MTDTHTQRERELAADLLAELLEDTTHTGDNNPPF
jgi:hypothetical protein